MDQFVLSAGLPGFSKITGKFRKKKISVHGCIVVSEDV